MRTTTTASSLLLLLAFGASAASATAAPPACSRLLTAAELAAAAGPGFEDLGQSELEPGQSSCLWLLDRTPNPAAVAFTFWERGAAADRTPLFDAQLKRAETLHENPHELLQGIGLRAALVPGKRPGAMAVLVLETDQGVAYAETDYLERAQVLGLAKAIAGP
jgi:hypothetical protein